MKRRVGWSEIEGVVGLAVVFGAGVLVGVTGWCIAW